MADPETIYNWRRLDDRITTSGQPTEQQLVDIQALGVRHIINLGLHSHEKALPDEAASVGRLGMTYIRSDEHPESTGARSLIAVSGLPATARAPRRGSFAKAWLSKRE